ncbi:helix-turn-helix transcriptional regulator [Paenibacillus sp. JJ-223]|uniref:helix-turn-helix domain-containing protein n=1 Tax=Paenibacillus sp. JJ-223 TaxID=2905647 RepID=UPI001F1ABFF4|nr:helix-turn-helix transcriptional regulator [Paenibacillus sp. JJ-223]CAH1209218.1 hypothetical protein PAECIP111890_03295 [Paenibacillus sp. JJ-223]
MSFAEVTGISITMLGQIERCESHLSIATVWKIANGLKLSITALISEPVQDASVIPLDRVRMWTEDEGRIRIYPHFSIEDGRPFETYMMEMNQYGVLRAAPHNKGRSSFRFLKGSLSFGCMIRNMPSPQARLSGSRQTNHMSTSMPDKQ